MTSIKKGLTNLIKTQLKIRHYVLFNFVMYSKYIFIFYHVNIIQMEKFEVEAEAGLKNYSIFLNPAEDIKIVFVF